MVSVVSACPFGPSIIRTRNSRGWSSCNTLADCSSIASTKSISANQSEKTVKMTAASSISRRSVSPTRCMPCTCNACMCVYACENAVVAVRSKWGDVGGWAPHSGRGLCREAETRRVSWVVAGSVYWSSEERSSPTLFLSLSLSPSFTLRRTPRGRPSTYTVFRPCATLSSLGSPFFSPLCSLSLSLLTPFAQIIPRWCPRHGRSAVVSVDLQTPTANYRRPREPIPTFSTLYVCLSFSHSLFLSSVAKCLSDSINRGEPIVAMWIHRQNAGRVKDRCGTNSKDKLSQKMNHYYGVSI